MKIRFIYCELNKKTEKEEICKNCPDKDTKCKNKKYKTGMQVWIKVK